MRIKWDDTFRQCLAKRKHSVKDGNYNCYVVEWMIVEVRGQRKKISPNMNSYSFKKKKIHANKIYSIGLEIARNKIKTYGDLDERIFLVFLEVNKNLFVLK